MPTYSEKLMEKGKSWETTITPSKPWLRQGVDLEWLKKEYRKMLEFFAEGRHAGRSRRLPPAPFHPARLV